jgi:hypothetical protein
MTDAILEKRVADLERKVADLIRKRDWRSTIGMFAGDALMQEIDEEGRKIREADREHARSDRT